MTRVGIIGFGIMGQAAGEKLLAAGHGLSVTDPSPNTPEKAKAIGAEFAGSITELADRSEVVLLFLPGPEQIRSVVSGARGLLVQKGQMQVIVDHSTADPETAQDMADLAQVQEVGWIDAPVLGRPSAAGSWALPCGATSSALEIARPVLETYARAVFDMGGPGQGHAVKLLNQMMFGAINAMTAEMMATSEKLGLAPSRLYEIITSSQAGTVSNLFKELGQRIQRDDYDNPTFSVKLLEKDIRLGLQMARKADIKPKLGTIVARMNEDAIEQGYGDQDTSVLWKAFGRE